MTDCESDYGSPLPPVSQRLDQLRPSRELLEYYRQKVSEFDNEHEDMLKKLQKYKASYEDQHRMELELTQREQEISDLQKAISDLQVCVLQEREQVLRLYAENDKLRIREVGDRKRIQHLLAIAGPAAAEVSYFHKEPPSKIIIPQKDPKSQLPNDANRPTKLKSSKQSKTQCQKVVNLQSEEDNQTLALQVEALQAQLEEQTKLAKDQVNALLEERRIIQEESNLAQQRDKDRYERYSQRLRDTQALLHESTQDILSLKKQHRSKEKKWMSEKDKLLREMDVLKEQTSSIHRAGDGDGLKPRKVSALTFARACVSDYEVRQQLESEAKALEQQLEQAAKLADMYREQCVQAEDELARIREESEVHRDIFKERTEKMTKRLELMTTRYVGLEKRRESEVEGFKTDVKHLRKRLKEVEKQLYKVSIAGPVSDVDILQTVRNTAGRSRAIQNELKTLKSKLYGLEGDLRGIY